MKDKKYTKLVRATQNPNAHRWEHYLTGISDETGELNKLFKKSVQKNDLGEVDTQLLAEELGDLLFFLTSLADLYGITLKEVKESNIEKLRKRFPDGFYTEENDSHRNRDHEYNAILDVLDPTG